MLAALTIYVGIAVAALAAWYAALSHYNRRLSRRALRWIEAAFGGRGRVVGVQWTGPGRFHAQLQLAPNTWFLCASIEVQLAPRELPLRWVAARLRREPELLIFEADLEVPPSYWLEVQHHRWCGRTRPGVDGSAWQTEHCAPILLTTKRAWQSEIAGSMSSLLSCSGREFLSVIFRQTSPHFSATIPLAAVAPSSSSRGELLGALQELAGSASQSRF